MRVGFNPNKDKNLVRSDYYHKIIIPVYIPNFEGYFKDSFRIFKICLESLYKTIHQHTYISIATNGCCDEVIEFVNYEYNSGRIHEVVHNKENIGKINSVLKSLSGTNETLITITDADVLFCQGWQEGTYEVFSVFSKAGVVSTSPGSKSYGKYDAIFYWDYFFSKRLRFTNVKDPEALISFARSIGNEAMYNQVHLSKYLTLTNKGIVAVAGAAHFVATYKGEIFNHFKNKFSEYSLGGNSESLFLDTPALKQGFYRLSTSSNFTYHMGNVYENWMQEKLNQLENRKCSLVEQKKYLKIRGNSFKFFFVNKVYSKILLKRKVLLYVLIWKGLTRKEAKEYLT